MAVAASLAQLGQVMFQAPAKLMVTEFVEMREQPESFAWLRTANNLGQVMSYSIGALFSSFGIPFMMFFDSTTSWLAAGAGLKLLPSEASREKLRAERASSEAAAPSLASSEWMNFALVTLILAGFNFLYDLYMIGIAGKCELVFGCPGAQDFFPGDGHQLRSLLGVLGVRRATFWKIQRSFFRLGMVFNVARARLIGPVGFSRWPLFYLGCFLITASEILFFRSGADGAFAHDPWRKAARIDLFALTGHSKHRKDSGRRFGLLLDGLSVRPLPLILGSGGVILALVLAGRSRFISIFKLEEIIT